VWGYFGSSLYSGTSYLMFTGGPKSRILQYILDRVATVSYLKQERQESVTVHLSVVCFSTEEISIDVSDSTDQGE
jgi:hypothetical protein